MMLTYLAIVATYIPPIVEEFRKLDAREPTEISAHDTTPDALPAASTSAPPAAQPPEDAERTPPSSAGVLLAIAFLVAIACIAPFLAGFENIIGLVIIGIGLYEAWKLNRRSTLTITGPHTLARPPIEAAGA